MCSNVTQIDVIDGGNMNVDLFVEKYAYSGKPLLVKNATNNWKAMTTVRIMSFRQDNNDKFSVKFLMFVLISFFQPSLKSDLKEVQLTQNHLFQFKATL